MNDKPCINPIEDQRRQALEHYNELATKCSHWSSFVQRAIEAYNPTPSPTVDKEAILEKHWKHSTVWDAGDGHSRVDCPRCCYEKNAYAAMDDYSTELRKELETYKSKVEFYREATDRCREFVFGRNDIGEPNQPLWDAVHDKLTALQSSNESKDREIADLKEKLGNEEFSHSLTMNDYEVEKRAYAQLTASLTNTEKEIDELKQDIDLKTENFAKLLEQLIRAEKEIERLKGLIEPAFKDPYKKGRVHPGNNMNKDYEQFKTENKL